MNTIKWQCDDQINQMVIETKHQISEYIKMLNIQAISKLSPNIKQDTDKTLDNELIEEYLKKRGYSKNYILGKLIMVKGFTCVNIMGDYLEVWHDKTNNDKSVFINKSLLTGLPLTLNYMERI